MSIPQAPPLSILGDTGPAIAPTGAASPAPAAAPAASAPPAAAGPAADNSSQNALAIKPDIPQLEPELSNIKAIPTRKTLMIVNTFIIQTTSFINSFARLCEKKLAKTARDIQKLEIVLKLLETKLHSIEWLGAGGDQSAVLENVTFDEKSATATTAGGGVPSVPPVGGESKESKTDEKGEEKGDDEKEEKGQGQSDAIPLSKHPRFAIYFKLLSLGVPKQQLRLKMQGDGVDPKYIDMSPTDPAPDIESAVAVVENAESSSEEEDQEFDD